MRLECSKGTFLVIKSSKRKLDFANQPEFIVWVRRPSWILTSPYQHLFRFGKRTLAHLTEKSNSLLWPGKQHHTMVYESKFLKTRQPCSKKLLGAADFFFANNFVTKK
jgi:hypothetical protein